MSPDDLMRQIDDLSSHVWMVRTFIKHSEEAEEDDELAKVHRELYDFMIALGPGVDAQDSEMFLKACQKKIGKLQRATELFELIQPDISDHTNFKMAVRSLRLAVDQVVKLAEQSKGMMQ